MAENNIELKTVSELLDMSFFIPSYQRGYRWNEQQVKDLLNDIWDFIESDPTKDEWYCLQPIVSKSKQTQLEIIDGQQRLTTIFLILKHLEAFVESDRKNFKLEYATRNSAEFNSEEFIFNIEKKTEEESLCNIDYFHIYTAFSTIKKWFKDKSSTHNSVSSKFITPFLEKTKVIWYETNGDGRDIFSRINIGKIPLTNAELIKALFLNSSNFKTESTIDKERIRLKQLEIATEWDNIEAELHNEEFWFFINKEENEKETRIEFIFELIVGKPKRSEDNYYTFRKFSQKFSENTEKIISENWELVKLYFQTVKNWFYNRELYHKIGFLITVGKEDEVKTLIEEKLKKSATDFHKFIDYKKQDENDSQQNGKIQNVFENIDVYSLEKKDDAKVRMVLLLHNIQTMLDNKKENTRFPFNRYKKKTNDNKGWDVEHIHAIATQMPQKQEQQEDWLKYAKEILVLTLEIEENRDTVSLSDEEKIQNKELIETLERLIKTPYNSKSFETHFSEISEYLSGQDINDLSNLALLDLGTNRGYKNDFFSHKRQVIIGKDKTNTFVPICTKNAFMKYYSSKIEQMTFWSETDRCAYFENIKEVLKNYLPTK